MYQKSIDGLKRQGAILCAKDAGWRIMETANVNAEHRMKKHKRVKLKLRLGASSVFKADFSVYHVKTREIVTGKWSICDIKRRYQTEHDSNEMRFTDDLEKMAEYIACLAYAPWMSTKKSWSRPNSWPSTSYWRQNIKTYLPTSWNRPSWSKCTTASMTTHFRQMNHRGSFKTSSKNSKVVSASQHMQTYRRKGWPISKLRQTRMANYCSTHHTACLHLKKYCFRGK